MEIKTSAPILVRGGRGDHTALRMNTLGAIRLLDVVAPGYPPRPANAAEEEAAKSANDARESKACRRVRIMATGCRCSILLGEAGEEATSYKCPNHVRTISGLAWI